MLELTERTNYSICRIRLQTSHQQPWFSRARCLTFLQNALHGYVVLVSSNLRYIHKKDGVQIVSQREHRYRPHHRDVEDNADATIRLQYGSPMLQKFDAILTVNHNNHSRRTSPLTYSVRSGFIWNCPGLTSTVDDPTVPLLAAFTGACSFGSARFFK